MSESKELPKKLPPMEKEIEIDLEGSLTKRHYQGVVTFQIPNTKMRSRAALKRAELNGGIREELLDRDVADFHYIIAYLFATVKDAPKWWKESESGYSLYDSNVVEHLFMKAKEFEAGWIKEVWGEPEAEKDNG